MYKKTSKADQYINRSGSSSTRAKRSGAYDLAPDVLDISYTADLQAKEYAELLDKKRSLGEKVKEKQVNILSLNKKLKLTIPHKEYIKFKELRTIAGLEFEQLHLKLNEINKRLKELNVANSSKLGANVSRFRPSSSEHAFMEIARIMLPHDVYNDIYEAAKELFKDGYKK